MKEEVGQVQSARQLQELFQGRQDLAVLKQGWDMILSTCRVG